MTQVKRKMFRPLYDHEEVIRNDLLDTPIVLTNGFPLNFSGDHSLNPILPIPLFGELCGVTFRRAERGWLAKGSIPLSVVLPFYEDEILRNEVRVDDLIYCPPPEKEYLHEWIHPTDAHFGVGYSDGVTVIKDEQHRLQLKKHHPLEEYKGDSNGWCWYTFVPSGTHLKDGCVQLLGIYSKTALRTFAQALVAHHQTVTN